MSQDAKRKGALILTEARSGSNWLGSLTNSTGLLGKSEEWLARKALGRKFDSLRSQDYLDRAVEASSTENGVFCIKVFPKHLHRFHIQDGTDVLQYMYDAYDVQLVRLIRRDTVRQAVSLAKGFQTKQWTSGHDTHRSAAYDFEAIGRAYMTIVQSNAFWEAYLALRGLDAVTVYYEDMVGDPMPYVRAVAEHAGITDLPEIASNLRVQRDAISEEWRERFLEEVSQRSIVGLQAPSGPYKRSMRNFLRFLRGRNLK